MKKNNCILGVAINDYDGKIFINHKHIKSYHTWKNMLQRCYDKKYQKNNPTYIGCKVCDEWLYFSNFKKWFDENYPKQIDDVKLELDKDLLSNNNKIYSPKNCVFLPHKVNSFIRHIKIRSDNVSGFTGVSYHKIANKWECRIRDFETGKNKYLGLFNDIDTAHNIYVNARYLELEKAKQYLKNLGYGNNIIEALSKTN